MIEQCDLFLLIIQQLFFVLSFPIISTTLLPFEYRIGSYLSSADRYIDLEFSYTCGRTTLFPGRRFLTMERRRLAEDNGGRLLPQVALFQGSRFSLFVRGDEEATVV